MPIIDSENFKKVKASSQKSGKETDKFLFQFGFRLLPFHTPKLNLEGLTYGFAAIPYYRPIWAEGDTLHMDGYDSKESKPLPSTDHRSRLM